MTTKYPIILVHGIIIKDFLFVKSFGQIDRILKVFGFTVYKSRVDGFGTIENNAQILKDEILKIIEETKCEKVNIIAHSKGGLDSKYMIQELGMEDYVASLTTLCTPHKGSPIATGILKFPRWMLKFVAFWINLWYRIFGDKHPNTLKVCEQLAKIDSIEMDTLNFNKKVYCQSYSTKMKRAREDFVMGIPFMFFRHFEKGTESDGLVGKDSARFGDYKGEAIEDSISHSEIIDFMVKRKKKDKIYAFYSTLCEDLKARGY